MMTAAFALLPIALILALMVGLRWSAARAGVAGMAATLFVAVWAFSFPEGTHPALDFGAALLGVGAESGFTALTILWIIGPALGIHQLQLRTGAAETLRSALGSFAPDPRILALLVAWFFVLFMEGAAGFGASVALAAPFLVAVGFRPVEAVTITLIGHAVGVSFGAIGTPVLPQVAITGLTGLEIARATGIYHSLLGWFPLLVMLVLVVRSAPGEGGWEGGIRGWTAVAFGAFLVPYTALWYFVGPELPTVGGALFGGAAFVALLAWTGRRGLPPAPRTELASAGPGASPPPGGIPEAASGAAAVEVERPSAREVARASAPYLVLVGLVLLTRLVPPLRIPLQGLSWSWEVEGAFAGTMAPLYHPGTILLLGFVVGAALQGARLSVVLGAVVDATRRLIPVAVALFAMLVIARTMIHSGMTDVLAVAAAESAGGGWPLISPFVGMLGTFVTGSATASNILFTGLQQETALRVGLPVAGTVGAQGFGAAVGNMICPHNVIAASATVGLEGREGEVLRRTLWVTLAYTGLGGLLALVLLG